MYEFLHEVLSPYYVYIRLIHLPTVFLWMFSVTIGYVHFLVPVMKAWRKNEGDPEITLMRNWVFERFDQGIAVEHFAFPLVVLSGVLLVIAGGWGPESGWLVLKLAILVSLALPIEIMDYYISHMNGNKRYRRERNGGQDWEAYEEALHTHWWFFLITTPMISIVVISVLFLAIVKPF